MSNTVEYCRIVCILGHFWAIFTCFLHYSTLTNKNTNNYSFWFDFSDLNQIIIRFDSSVFDIIRLFIANHVKLFASFRFVLWFESPLFWLVSIRLRIQPLCIRFGHESNHKNHYSPKLTIRQPLGGEILRVEPTERWGCRPFCLDTDPCF